MEFRILGPLEVADGSRGVAVSGKPRVLLARLLLRPGEVVPVDALVDELWGDEPPESATNALQVFVSRLRRALGRDVVVRRGAGYAVDVDPASVDVVRFERLVAEARAAEPARAAELLREAVALWRGPPEVATARLEELRIRALEDLLDAELAVGRHDAAIPQLHALVEAEPLRERPRAQLMLALYRAGRQADALAEFARARDLLVEELGVEPGPELQRLQRAILQQDASLAAPARTGSAAPLLPAPATPLVGREEELVAIADLFADGARLVTLTGPGGIGKTRLALEAARALDPHATLVALAAIEDASLVAGAIASALRLEVAALSAEEAVVAHLRDRATVLLLDNFEQLLDAAPLVSRRVTAAPRLRVIVTSRAVLRVAGEREYEVPPLGDGVELFRQRAFGSIDDTESVRAICERLDGIPLAIELAAARTKLLPPAALLERLSSRLELLTSGTRDAPERQRTMRAAIDWSYRLLDADEQVLFARLAVFAAPATLPAIEEVCGAGLDVLETLASLVDKSLVRRRGDRDPRYGMLETLREYADGQLESLGEADALRRRHLAWIERLVADAEVGSDGPHQDEWFERLERELPNVRSVLAYALEIGDARGAVAVAGGLRRFWQVHGHLAEGLRWSEAALAIGDGATVAAAKAWAGIGILAGEAGDFERSRRAFERSLERSREVGDPTRVASALSNLGTIALFDGRYEEAERLYDDALVHYRRDPRPSHHIASTLENLGAVALVRRDIPTAVQRLRESLELTERLNELRSIASNARWLARALLYEGELEEARELLLRSLDITAQLRHRQGEACTVDFTAAYAAAAGDPGLAARLVAAADAVWASTGAARQPDVEELVAETERDLGPGHDGDRAVGAAATADDAIAWARAALVSNARHPARVNNNY